MKKIVLASASPRRAEILKQVGVKFTVCASDAEEEILNLPPAEFVKATALQKGKVVASGLQDALVIAADTVVVIMGRIMGKPANDEEAFAMLSVLSGTFHDVYTGLCIIDMPTGKYYINYARTKVFFKELTPFQIKTYIASGEPFDKAGAYGIQGKGALLVEKIEGCYFNVVGLPVSLLYEAIKEFGIDLLSGVSTNEDRKLHD